MSDPPEFINTEAGLVAHLFGLKDTRTETDVQQYIYDALRNTVVLSKIMTNCAIPFVQRTLRTISNDITGQVDKILRGDEIWKMWFRRDFPEVIADLGEQVPPFVEPVVLEGHPHWKRYYFWTLYCHRTLVKRMLAWGGPPIVFLLDKGREWEGVVPFEESDVSMAIGDTDRSIKLREAIIFICEVKYRHDVLNLKEIYMLPVFPRIMLLTEALPPQLEEGNGGFLQIDPNNRADNSANLYAHVQFMHYAHYYMSAIRLPNDESMKRLYQATMTRIKGALDAAPDSLAPFPALPRSRNGQFSIGMHQ